MLPGAGSGSLSCAELELWDASDDEARMLQVSMLQSSVRRFSEPLPRSPEGHAAIHFNLAFANNSGNMLILVVVGAVLLVVAACAIRWILSTCNDKSASTGGLLWALRQMPQVLVFACWLSWYQYFSGDPFDAFMESMTSCPRPMPDHGRCPDGSVFRHGVCEPEPSSSPEWSLSNHCADKSYVLSQAAQLNGINASIASALGMITVLVAGAYMDTWGRRPVLLTFLFANVVVKALLSISCFMTWSSFVVIIVIQNIIEVMTASPVYPALNCMISDLSGGHLARRGDCYAALETMKNMASLIALLSGYPVLKAHFTNYIWFWSSLTLVSIAANLIFWAWLPETLQAKGRSSDSKGGEAEAPRLGEIWRSCLDGFLFTWRDAFLRQYLIMFALVTLAVNGAWSLSAMFLQSFLHVEQANASLCRACWFMALLCGSALSSPMIRHCGVHATHAGALAVMSVSWFLCGLGGIWKSAAPHLFWAFGVGTFSLAYGVLTPCFGTIVSDRVPALLQGKVFSVSIIIGTVVGIPLGPLWSQVFFRPGSVGWEAGLSWLVSSGILFVMAVWFSVLCLVYRSPGTQAKTEM
eukprot:TRINITY_DN62343_c0_g1_i1.p1 TRINITY_DN62343_c0_g1~~TRINITY_DN62343_c0_g1_i1.p1  ORF type:complete len:597 (-),score=102.72 TRINITY_DN62343_c0_g1_i1:73-1818(-)